MPTLPAFTRRALPVLLCLGILAAPVVSANAPAVDNPDEELVLNLRDAEINGLVEIVSQELGMNFIVDPRVRGQVNVVSGTPIRRGELYDLFLGVLKSYGFAAVSGSDGSVRIVPDVQAKEHEVPALTDSSRGDDIITHVISVKHISAGQLVRILRPLVPKGGHLAAAAESNSLVIADTAANVRRIQGLIERIDLESMEDFELVTLQHGSAIEMVNMIEGLDGPGGEEQSRRGRLIADERTNSVVLRGDPETRRSLRGIIERLDVPGEGGATQVHYLRYAKAEEVAEVLRGIAEGREEQQYQQGSGSAAGSVNSNRREQNRIRIQAHESTNTVVIFGPAEISRELSGIIRQLDIRRAQVLVEAVIAEVSYDRARELGVQWGFGNQRTGVGVINFNRSQGILDLGAGINAFLEGNVATPPSIGSGATLGGIGSIGSSQIALLVSALQGDSSSNILSTPSLLTLDNEEAEIVVGQNVPFIVGRSVEDSGQAFDTIQREDVGIKLRIRPQINEGNAVRLEIAQEVSQIAPGVTGAADIVTNTRSLSTHVMVDDDQLIVLGGLIDDQMVETRDQVPGLGSIPGLGRLFRYDTARQEKRNLMVFLRPVIVRDSVVAESLTHGKYSFIRDQQLKEQARQRGIVSRDQVPVLPDWNYLLSLPAPFENALEGKPAPRQSIPAPPGS